MSEHQWSVKCRAMFLAIHAATNLARDIGMDVEEMLRVYMLQMNTNADPELRAMIEGKP